MFKVISIFNEYETFHLRHIPRLLSRDVTDFPFRIDFDKQAYTFANILVNNPKLSDDSKLKFILAFPSNSMKRSQQSITMFSGLGFAQSKHPIPMIFSLFFNQRHYVTPELNIEQSLDQLHQDNIQLSTGKWTPTWVSKVNDMKVPLEIVQSYYNTYCSKFKRSDLAKIRAEEKRVFKHIPFTDFRTILQDQVRNLIQDRKESFYFIGIDDDAQSIVDQAGRGVLTRLKRQIYSFKKLHRYLPSVLSGGYTISQQQDAFAHIGVEIDMSLREMFFKNPLTQKWTYFAEPFTAFLANKRFFNAPFKHAGFAEKSCENKQKLQSLRELGLSEEEIVFNRRLALETSRAERMKRLCFQIQKLSVSSGGISDSGKLALWNEKSLKELRSISQSHWDSHNLYNKMMALIKFQKPEVRRVNYEKYISSAIQFYDPINLALNPSFYNELNFNKKMMMILEQNRALFSFESTLITDFQKAKSVLGDFFLDIQDIFRYYFSTICDQLSSHIEVDQQKKLYEVMNYIFCVPGSEDRVEQKISLNQRHFIEGKNVDERDFMKMEYSKVHNISNLHLAAITGNTSAVKKLIEKHSNFQLSKSGISPLMAGLTYLSEFGSKDLDLISELLKIRFVKQNFYSKPIKHIDCGDLEGKTPLGFVLKSFDEPHDIVKLLIDRGVDLSKLTYCDDEELCLPPLFMAIKYSSNPIPILELMRKNSVSFLARDSEGETVLTYCLQLNQSQENVFELCRYLLSLEPSLLGLENSESQTPLSLAIELKRSDLCKLCCDLGANYEPYLHTLEDMGLVFKKKGRDIKRARMSLVEHNQQLFDAYPPEIAAYLRKHPEFMFPNELFL